MKKYAVLINSCDAYADLWDSFVLLLRAHWSGVENCNIYINTEKTEIFKNELGIKLLNTEQNGPDQWGKRLINCLSQIQEEYVVVLMDDFFLRSNLNEQILDNCISCFEDDKDIAVFYLMDTLKNENIGEKVKYEGFVEIPKRTNYRLNSAPALWRKDKLLNYIKETDNPWAWEYFGTCRTNHSDDKFFSVTPKTKDVYDYAHAIYRGKWLEKEVNPLIQQYNLPINTSVRGGVKEGDAVPKRSIKWKFQFVLTGLKMVGIEALFEIYRDIKMQNKINKTAKTVVLMFVLSLGCKALGFLRQMLLAKYFGTGNVVDAYVMAQSIPNILFGGILVSFSGSFLPLYSKRYENHGAKAANEYTSRILIILFILSSIIACFGIVFSDQITNIMAGGLNQEAKTITSHYLKFTFGYTFFAATAGIYSNYLHYQGVFSKQIFGDYIQNLFFISFIWIAYYFGNYYLILGLFLGYVGRVIYLLFLAGRYSFKFSLTFNGILADLNEVKNYAIPIFIATTANEINTYVDRVLAAKLDSGSISALNYATQLNTVFMELTVTILATIIFPKLTQAFNTKNIKAYLGFVRRGLVLCSIIAIPLALGSVVFSQPMIELIFQRGAFVSESTIVTGSAFGFYSIGAFSLAINTYMIKVFYSAGNTKTPMVCAFIGVAINIVMNFVLVGMMKANGLALATSIANIVNSVLLVISFYFINKKLLTREEVTDIVKIVIISIFVVGVNYYLYKFGCIVFEGTHKLLFIAICCSCALMYLFGLFVFKVKELRRIVQK